MTSLGKLLLQSLQVKMFDQSPMRHDPAPVEARASDLAPVHGGSSTAEISSSSQALDAPHHDPASVHETTISTTYPSGPQRRRRRRTHPSVKARDSDLAPVHGGSSTAEISSSSQALDAPHHTAVLPTHPSIKAGASDLAPVHGGSFISSQALDAPDHAAGPPSPPAPVHGSFLVLQTIHLLFVQRGDNGQWQ